MAFLIYWTGGLANLISSSPSIEDSVPACYKDFNLIEIPDMMKETGRPVGAEMMARWFRNSGYTMPPDWKIGKIDPRRLPGFLVDTSIIKMQWLLRFDRARAPFTELRNTIRGNNAESLKKSKGELFEMLRRNNKFTSQTTYFGDTNGKPNVLDVHQTAHLNSRRVGAQVLEKVNDPLDDLYCALGAFTAHMAASGIITPIKGGKSGRATHQVTIQKLGFYIRDCYDFNEDQLLGFWGREKVSKFAGPGLYVVDNETFRNWRIKHGRGCDFLVFSDVLWEPAPSGLVWEYPY